MVDPTEMIQFLYDRLDEDEAIAQAAKWRTDQEDPLERLEFPGGWLSAERIEEAGLDEQTAAQIMRWSPQRALLEVAAKRSLVEHLALKAADYETPSPAQALAEGILREIAAVYAANKGWRLEWAPSAW